MRLIEVQYHRAGEHDRFDWADSREGPFGSAPEAIRFAESELKAICRPKEETSSNEIRRPLAW